MRVIAGKFKGRTIVAPKQDARPTLDRMKETLFNILNYKLQGAVVLDLFAGSGQLAIESLSRGAQSVVLCDNSRDALSAIKTNFAKIGVEPKIIFGDYSQCLQQCGCKFDVVFVDPPYKSNYYVDVLEKLCICNLLNEDAVVVCEHLAEHELPQKVADLQIYDSRKMGTVKFDFYRRLSCE